LRQSVPPASPRCSWGADLALFDDAAVANDRADLERARILITSAIEKNPDAHFGRERYQLLAIESLLDPVEPASTESPAALEEVLGLRRDAYLARLAAFCVVLIRRRRKRLAAAA
jgi:hypothetical protein